MEIQTKPLRLNKNEVDILFSAAKKDIDQIFENFRNTMRPYLTTNCNCVNECYHNILQKTEYFDFIFRCECSHLTYRIVFDFPHFSLQNVTYRAVTTWYTTNLLSLSSSNMELYKTYELMTQELRSTIDAIVERFDRFVSDISENK